MSEYYVAAGIVAICVVLAGFEIVMANRQKEAGADAADWKRARGIVWIGVVLALLAWFVQRMTD